MKKQEKKETVVVGPNFHGYDLTTVTQGPDGVYTVFFRRRACG